MYEKILVSRQRAVELMSASPGSIRKLVERGRLVESDAFLGKRIVKGVTLGSLMDYNGWSQRVVDELLVSHRVDPGTDRFHLLTSRDETSVETVAD